MGMYDNVFVNPDFFTLSDPFFEEFKIRTFQTKDLENCLCNYEIDKEGRLLLEGEPVKNPPKILSIIDYWYEDLVRVSLTYQQSTNTYRVSEIKK
jgi:hypothetical protein